MDRFEEAVLEYITAERQRFINPQFDIPYDEKTKEGGTCPDFVVLDFKDKTVYIVEVTTSSNPTDIINRLSQRKIDG